MIMITTRREEKKKKVSISHFCKPHQRTVLMDLQTAIDGHFITSHMKAKNVVVECFFFSIRATKLNEKENKLCGIFKV
jgi:hypothetical protein